jgi:hypothetical protein
MNPWALVILGIGILLIIMGVKGSYGGVIGALTGKPYTGVSSSSGSPGKLPHGGQPPMNLHTGVPSPGFSPAVRPGLA